jgi:hypothetical protein
MRFQANDGAQKEIRMIGNRLAHAAIALVLVTTFVSGQQPAPVNPPRPKPGPAPAVPVAVTPPPQTKVAPEAPPRQNVNVRVELTITEQRAKALGASPNRKLVTIIAADGFRNAIRSTEKFYPPVDIPLNVDVTPTIVGDRIRVALNLEYDFPMNEPKKGADGQFERTILGSQIRETLVMVLENGKPLIVSQSADPVSDRQVTVEVRATILK